MVALLVDFVVDEGARTEDRHLDVRVIWVDQEQVKCRCVAIFCSFVSLGCDVVKPRTTINIEATRIEANIVVPIELDERYELFLWVDLQYVHFLLLFHLLIDQ